MPVLHSTNDEHIHALKIRLVQFGKPGRVLLCGFDQQPFLLHRLSKTCGRGKKSRLAVYNPLLRFRSGRFSMKTVRLFVATMTMSACSVALQAQGPQPGVMYKCAADTQMKVAQCSGNPAMCDV